MLKLLGAALIMVGAVWCGCSAAGRLRRRAETLTRLVDALTLLETELSFRLTPTLSLLEKLRGRERESAGRFFGAVVDGLRADPELGLEKSWAHGVDKALPMLKGEEREALLALGGVLGRYDGEVQRQALRRCGVRLEELRRRAGEEADRLGRVYIVLGVASGVLAVIVLV